MLLNKFLETNYPRDRAVGVFSLFHFDVKDQKPKFDYYTSPKTVKTVLTSPEEEVLKPRDKPRGILLIKTPFLMFGLWG